MKTQSVAQLQKLLAEALAKKVLAKEKKSVMIDLNRSLMLSGYDDTKSAARQNIGWDVEDQAWDLAGIVMDDFEEQVAKALKKQILAMVKLRQTKRGQYRVEVSK